MCIAPPWVAGDYPKWLDPHLSRVFGEERIAEGAALASRAPLDLRVNTLKAELEKVAAKYELPLLRAAVLSAKAILAAADGDAQRVLQDAGRTAPEAGGSLDTGAAQDDGGAGPTGPEGVDQD